MASLRDLGLSEYESRAYRSLLETGPTTAKELSRTSDVPMGRIYDVLNSLETQNLVRSQTASRPKKYVAVEPETALDRLLENKEQDLEEQLSQFESIAGKLEEQLEASEPVDEQFWTAALGAQESIDLLVERLAAADDQILFVAATPTSRFDVESVGERIADELEHALGRGIPISLLEHPTVVESLPEAVGERYREQLQDHDHFGVRVVDDIGSTFAIIDHVEICIEVPHPLNREEAFALINLKDAEFAATVEESFENRWQQAQRLSF
ncbi:TrmB family transcriptional regulator [Halovenus rubra]|uniref:TrmB family transcriptional regulator n=2 Tax=Halovenus rubra TaxID=869890 RepID=A0ACC7DWF9_9EURY|nr:helix-turn-helix domain-containing protein [Halovenus rubra]